MKLLSRSKASNDVVDAEKEKYRFLEPVVEAFIEEKTFMTVNPHDAYFWLRSQNAHLFAEALAKNNAKQLLDVVKPLKDDMRRAIIFVMILLGFAMAVIALWLFIGKGQVSAPSVPNPMNVIPTPPAPGNKI